MIPLDLAAKWAPGRIVDSRQVYEAMKLNVLIPEAKAYNYFFRSLEDVFLQDRGGLIISPKIGIHENVCVLDFESMYPNIILRENVSYENCTLTQGKCSIKGLLPRMVDAALHRRLYFKHLCKKLPRNSRKYIYADQRQKALKAVLVVIYGYSGCTWNRFQNTSTFEKINLRGREILIEAINIALENGYQVIYADTDSIFVKNPDATEKDYENLAEQISEKVNYPKTVDNLYQFLILLPSKNDPLFGTVKRYCGKLYDGSLHYRGIEVRKRDTPEFIRKFQEKLMYILFNAKNVEEVKKNYRSAVEYTCKTYEQVLHGK